MRHIDKGMAPAAADGSAIVFTHYRDAGPHLMQRIGRYCCYCERTIPASLAVEHKFAKVHHPHLELAWANFLLACANCNSVKGDTDAAPLALIWPDEEDTCSAIDYARSGAIKPAEHLVEGDSLRVLNLLRLVGLNRVPGETTSSDHRFFDRQEVWRKAEQAAIDLAECDTPQMRRAIVETAKSSGGYSIWLKVFGQDLAMQTALKTAFPGTVMPQLQA